MDIYVTPISVEEILPLRELHRTEMNCQIVHDSLHERGFTHSYSIEVDGDRGVRNGRGLRRRDHDEPGRFRERRSGRFPRATTAACFATGKKGLVNG